jgi:hypothetical protein
VLPLHVPLQAPFWPDGVHPQKPLDFPLEHIEIAKVSLDPDLVLPT